MSTKLRTTNNMNLYQLIHHAARDKKPAAEILRLCRIPLDSAMATDVVSGPQWASTVDTLMALWAVAARLNDAERQIETLKRRARRDRQRSGGKPTAELLKKKPAEAPLDPEDNEAFMHAFEKND